MAVEEDALEQFIEECTGAGIMLPTDMRDKALARIKEIDQEIERVDRTLRPERLRLLKVIQGLGFEMPKAKRAAPIREEAKIADLSEEDKSIAIQICDHIAKNGPASARALMKACHISVENDHQVYNIIKWLCGNGYCVRNAANEVVKGQNWKERPVSA